MEPENFRVSNAGTLGHGKADQQLLKQQLDFLETTEHQAGWDLCIKIVTVALMRTDGKLPLSVSLRKLDGELQINFIPPRRKICQLYGANIKIIVFLVN